MVLRHKARDTVVRLNLSAADIKALQATQPGKALALVFSSEAKLEAELCKIEQQQHIEQAYISVVYARALY